MLLLLLPPLLLRGLLHLWLRGYLCRCHTLLDESIQRRHTPRPPRPPCVPLGRIWQMLLVTSPNVFFTLVGLVQLHPMTWRAMSARLYPPAASPSPAAAAPAARPHRPRSSSSSTPLPPAAAISPAPMPRASSRADTSQSMVWRRRLNLKAKVEAVYHIAVSRPEFQALSTWVW